MANCLGKVPIDFARGLGFSRINTSTWPYGFIVSRAFGQQDITYEKFLEIFLPFWSTYQDWFMQQSLASLYGIGGKSRLSKVPAWAHIMPWGERSPREMMKWLPPRIRRNRRVNGNEIGRWKTGRGIMVADSQSSGTSHGRQFFDMCTSISSHGLWDRCNATDPYKVWVLKDGAEWRWMAYSGNHRTGAIATLGLSDVHVELKGVVSRSAVRCWPNVANGWFTPEEAESVFDRLFHGQLVPASQELLVRLNQTQ